MSFLSSYIRQQFKNIHDSGIDTMIILRRGNTVLEEQPAFLSMFHNGAVERQSEGGKSYQIDGEVHGYPELNIEIDDRLTASGVLFRVVYVKPDRTMGTVAEVSIIT